jgi:RNA polymerase sigma-70 factor (ECF subfamily)
MDEPILLARAQAGDERAFTDLVTPHRGEVRSHCYRMLGSFHDAEDVEQESLLRAWKGLGGFDGRGPIRPWLFRIATNRCLTLLESRPRRELPAGLATGLAAGLATGSAEGLAAGRPATEIAWLTPYPDPQADAERRETVALAFVAALQYLSPAQRAALLLREVLGFAAAEVADQLGTSVAAVNSALQRARKVMAERGVRQGQEPEAQIKDLADRYATAWLAADVDAIVAMLAEDATFAMPPLTDWFRGSAAIRAVLLTGEPLRHRWRMLPCRANGGPALAAYIWSDDLAAYRFGALDLLATEGDRITEVVAFLDNDLWAPLGLPATLPR